MRFMVAGCGSIGSRHIKNLLDLRQEVFAYDPSQEARSAAEKAYGIKTYGDLDDALEEDACAALICTPTSGHVPTAMKATKKGLHLFIEKPLSNDLTEVDSLIKTVEDKGLVSFMGFNMRYNKSLMKTKELLDSGEMGRSLGARIHFGSYLPDRHPDRDYRTGYGAKKALGGGVILDAVHQIDYANWLFGEVTDVFCHAEKKSDLDIDVEDYAEMLLRFKSNATASIHLDYLQRPYQNTCEIICEKGTIRWELALDFDVKSRRYSFRSDELRIYDAAAGTWDIIKGDDNLDDAYVREMKHFIECVQQKKSPKTDIRHGKNVLSLCLAAKESSEKNKVVEISR